MSKCNCGKEYGCIVRCCFTDCIHNSACCINPSDADTYCTLKEIDLILDEETGIMDCSQYQRTDKPYECIDCQLNKHGEIELDVDMEFIEIDNIEDLFK